MPEFQPARFGKYILVERLATGGMAQLYRAKILGVQGFEKLIAIKMILPHLAKEHELVSSFIDEAKLAALLNHQNIVQIYDFGSMEESYFISMEYLFGNEIRLLHAPEVIDLDDVLMIQQCGKLRLIDEGAHQFVFLGKVRQDHLDGDELLEALNTEYFGPVKLGHASRGKPLNQNVLSKTCRLELRHMGGPPAVRLEEHKKLVLQL